MAPATSAAPVLVACSHGTRDPAGQGDLDRLRAAVLALRPGLELLPAYVDVQPPAVGDVVRGLAADGRPAVVVPLLLSTGYHVRMDVAAAVSSAAGGAVAAEPLGPDGALVRVLAERLADLGTDPDDAVVLAAAGSSDPRASRDVEQVARGLEQLLGTPVTPGYLSAARPAVGEAVSEARRRGRRVSVASYLLARGHLFSRLLELEADRVAAPLLPHPSVAELVLRRYDAAAAGREVSPA